VSDATQQTHPVIITIDGPAGTGKSTVARLLASRLGLEFLDTGAMYRAAALLAINQAIDPHDGPVLAAALRESDLHFDWSTDPPRSMLGALDVTDRIRDLDVSEIVSIVAAQPAVRAVLVEQQRAIARRHPRLVTEGRDQGSVVFPEAPVRFFLTADVSVRASRRISQLVNAGKQADQDRVIRDIRERDRLDASRRDGPLVRPVGAIDVDSGTLDAAQVVDRMESVVREQLPDAGFDQ
jgi:cytidylate kinase